MRLLYDKEKELLLYVIAFSGQKGMDEFSGIMKNKWSGKYSEFCLTEEEMRDILTRIEMPDSMIEQVINAIKGDE